MATILLDTWEVDTRQIFASLFKKLQEGADNALDLLPALLGCDFVLILLRCSIVGLHWWCRFVVFYFIPSHVTPAPFSSNFYLSSASLLKCFSPPIGSLLCLSLLITLPCCLSTFWSLPLFGLYLYVASPFLWSLPLCCLVMMVTIVLLFGSWYIPTLYYKNVCNKTEHIVEFPGAIPQYDMIMSSKHWCASCSRYVIIILP